MSKGYVYILTNDSMPGLVKIGKTTRDVNARAAEVSNGTGVPTPFRVAVYVSTPECSDLELRMHERLNDRRVNPGREFFRVDLREAETLLRGMQREQVEWWLDEFIPDHTIVHGDEFVDIGSFPRSVYDVCVKHDLYPPDFARAIQSLTADELEPAIKRQAEATRERIQAYCEKKAELKVVGAND